MPQQRSYANVGGAFRRGAAAQRAGAGDYEGAASYVGDDPDLMRSYASLGEAQHQRQRRDDVENYSRSYASAYANRDFDSMETLAGKQGDIEGLEGARSARQSVTDQQRLEMWRGARQNLADLEAIEQGGGEGYSDYLTRARSALQQNPDMDPDLRAMIESAPEQYNPRFLGGMRSYTQRITNALLTPAQLHEMENDSRLRDTQERNATAAERRADAAERTAEAAMLRAERGGGDGGVSGSQEFSRANSLRDEYNQQTATYRTVADIAARSEEYMRRVGANPRGASGQADVGLVYALAKIYDPNSVVREGEFATMARQGGYGQQMQSWVTQALGGGFSTTIRNQIMTEIRNGLRAQETQRNQTRDRYQGLAQRANIDPALVIDDYSAGGAAPSAPGATTPQRPPGVPASARWNARTGQWEE